MIRPDSGHIRLAAAIQTCLALFVAFLVAPFQHVHEYRAGDPDSGEIHAHFFAGHTPEPRTHTDGPGIAADDDDAHEHARSVDGYTPVLPDNPAPFLLSRSPVIPAAQTRKTPRAQRIEPRANGPPASGPSIPRAPPL